MPGPAVTITIIGVIAAVVAAGMYLRWACLPVLVAFRLGRRAERIWQRADDEEGWT
jgi:hypothetical protein